MKANNDRSNVSWQLTNWHKLKKCIGQNLIEKGWFLHTSIVQASCLFVDLRSVIITRLTAWLTKVTYFITSKFQAKKKSTRLAEIDKDEAIDFVLLFRSTLCHFLTDLILSSKATYRNQNILSNSWRCCSQC